MQSTGQASTHAVSLVPMQGSAITYAMIVFPARDRRYHRAIGKNKGGSIRLRLERRRGEASSQLGDAAGDVDRGSVFEEWTEDLNAAGQAFGRASHGADCRGIASREGKRPWRSCESSYPAFVGWTVTKSTGVRKVLHGGAILLGHVVRAEFGAAGGTYAGGHLGVLHQNRHAV